MKGKKNYIIVKDRHPRISEVLNDCVSLCVPTSNGESLASILQKMCNEIEKLKARVAELEALQEE